MKVCSSTLAAAVFGPNKIQPTTGAILGDSVPPRTSVGPGTASRFQVPQS